MILIEDLGIRIIGTSGYKKRLGIYECPVCNKQYTCQTSHVKSGAITQCLQCANKEKATRKSKKSADSFITYSNTVHANRYDYTLVNYVNTHTCVDIICHEHGVFKQTPANHKNGQGCPKCSVVRVGKLASCSKIAVNADKLIPMYLEVHGDSYDYSTVKYRGYTEKISIICRVHGVFLQRPSAHLQGQGCPKCGDIATAGHKVIKAAMDFVDTCNAVHANKYDYTLVEYTGHNNLVKIICPEHGVFEQTPSNHKNGNGCQLCASYGFDRSKSAILYYIKVNNIDPPLYKIGITNRTIKDRFSKLELCKIQIIALWEFPIGKDAYDKEQEILLQYKEYKYAGPPIFSIGNTEIFKVDILKLDKEIHGSS